MSKLVKRYKRYKREEFGVKKGVRTEFFDFSVLNLRRDKDGSLFGKSPISEPPFSETLS